MKSNPFSDKASIADLGKFLAGGTQKSLDGFKPEVKVVGTSRLKLDPIKNICPKSKPLKKSSPKAPSQKRK